MSSDRLRAVVGAGEDDVTASADALRLVDDIVALRVGRGLTTVVDTLGLDAGRRAAWRELARAAGVPCVAVAFDTPAGECRERNRSRTKRIPADVLAGQLRAWPAVREALRSEGFADVIAPEPVRVVAAPFAAPLGTRRRAVTPAAAEPPARAAVPPAGLRFGLHLSQFAAPGGAPAMRGWLREVATAAEDAGFDAVYVMDHFRQIPQVGRPFDDMLESFTTLAYLAACTERVRLGALVAARDPPQRPAAGQDGGDAGRGQRRTGGVRAGPRLVRRRAGRPRHHAAAGRRSLRAARGRAAAAARAVGAGQQAVPRPGARRARGALLPEAAAGARAAARRRRRGAPHVAARGGARRRGQRLRRPRHRTSQGSRAARPLRGRRTGPGPGRRSPTSPPCWSATTTPTWRDSSRPTGRAGAARRATPRPCTRGRWTTTSSGSARSPTPAWRR